MKNFFCLIAFLYSSLYSATTLASVENSLTDSNQLSENDAKSVVAQGVIATVFAGTHVAPGLTNLSEQLVQFSNVSAGSMSATSVLCSNGGIYIYSWVKSSDRLGFSAGDQIKLKYNNCLIGKALLNGDVSVTTKSSATNLSIGDHDFQYEATFDKYSFSDSSNVATFDGAANIISQASKSNSNIQQMTVLTGQNVNVQGNNIMANYKEKCIVYFREYAAPSSKRYGLIGDVDLILNNLIHPLNVMTKRALIGRNTDVGFIAEIGNLDIKNKKIDLRTNAKFNDVGIDISADTDRNGSMDLEFVTDWSKLLKP